MLEIHITDLQNKILPHQPSNEKLATELNTVIQKAAKVSKRKEKCKQKEKVTYDEDNDITGKEIYLQVTHEESKKWNQIINADDPKSLWKSINWKGEINVTEKGNEPMNADELATFAANKVTVPISETSFDNLPFQECNNIEEPPITKEDIEKNTKKLKDKSKTTDGFSGNFIKSILPKIMMILTILFNNIFTDVYPNSVLWGLMHAIPKKGKLQIPNSVRFITVMNQFAKKYDGIITAQLLKYIKIPFNQTAYQKSKGCFLNVMTI